MGDLNARHTTFGDTSSNSSGVTLADMLVDLPLHRIYNCSPTYVGHLGTSIPDHILVSDGLVGRMGDMTIGPSIGSDHLPLLVATDAVTAPPPRPRFRVAVDYRNADWDSYRQTITRLLPAAVDVSDPAGIRTSIAHLTAVLKRGAATAIPRKRIDTARRPLPPHIINLIREKHRLYNRFKSTRDPALKTAWNRLNAHLRRSVIRHREDAWTSVCSSLDYRNGASFWHRFQCLTGQKSRPAAPLVVDGVVHATASDKARVFAASLARTYEFPQDPLFDAAFRTHIESELTAFEPSLSSHDVIPEAGQPHGELTAPITVQDILQALTRGRNSAPGEDGVTRLLLQHAPTRFIELLAATFTGCLLLGYLPPCLKTAVVVMIGKGSLPPSDPANHRPISLLNVLGKVLEKIIQTRLSTFAETAGLLPDTQSGFRSGRGTTDPLARLLTSVSASLNGGRCVLAAFLDISKAFDKVWHDGLCYKLLLLGVPLILVRLIKAFLTDRIARVRVEDALSDPFTPSAGVPQGSCLSPLLYLLYCHDVPMPRNAKSELAQYADDTVYWTSGRTAREVFRGLQQHISALQLWMSRWRVLPNASKTQLILFHHRHKSQRISQRPLRHSIRLWGDHVYPSRTARYLGVKLNDILNWSAHLDDVICRARKRLNLLLMLRGRLVGCHFSTLRHTYKLFIRPLFEYAAPALAPAQGLSIQRYYSLERRILRRLARLDPRTRNEDVYLATGVPPLASRLSALTATYIQRLHDGGRHALSTLLSTAVAFPVRPKFKYPFLPNVLPRPVLS